MTGPSAARPIPTAPGGIQARADCQQVEVRTYEGELIRDGRFVSGRRPGSIAAKQEP